MYYPKFPIDWYVYTLFIVKTNFFMQECEYFLFFYIYFEIIT